jgi:outer membrane protein
MKIQPVLRALAAAACVGAAAPVAALDLLDAYAQAATHDPSLRAAHEALNAGREKAVQGRALWRPQVQLSASMSQVQDRSSTTLPPALGLGDANGAGRMHEVALQLRQPIVDAKARAERQQLEQQSQLAELRHREAEQSLMQRVADAYFALLLADEQLRVVRAEQAAVTMQRDRAQARFELGRGKLTELQEAQARLDAVIARELSSRSLLSLREAQFSELTGAPAQGLAAVAAPFAPAPPQPDDAQAWQAQAIAGNVRVLVRQNELAIAAFETTKYALTARPTLDLVASASHQGQAGGLSTLAVPESRRTTAIGLQFSLPLTSGGAISSREREAAARHAQAGHELAAAQRDARLQAQDAYLALKTGIARVAALEQAQRSAATALEATTLGRDVGTRTELDVLDAQQRLYAAQLDLAQARHDVLTGRIRLAAVAGSLNEGDLAALNAQLAR